MFFEILCCIKNKSRIFNKYFMSYNLLLISLDELSGVVLQKYPLRSVALLQFSKLKILITTSLKCDFCRLKHS